jgi:hypothetical protein
MTPEGLKPGAQMPFGHGPRCAGGVACACFRDARTVLGRRSGVRCQQHPAAAANATNQPINRPTNRPPNRPTARFCAGYSVAMAEMKMFLALLARGYAFEADTDTKCALWGGGLLRGGGRFGDRCWVCVVGGSKGRRRRRGLKGLTPSTIYLAFLKLCRVAGNRARAQERPADDGDAGVRISRLIPWGRLRSWLGSRHVPFVSRFPDYFTVRGVHPPPSLRHAFSFQAQLMGLRFKSSRPPVFIHPSLFRSPEPNGCSQTIFVP